MLQLKLSVHITWLIVNGSQIESLNKLKQQTHGIGINVQEHIAASKLIVVIPLPLSLSVLLSQCAREDVDAEPKCMINSTMGRISN